MSDDDQRVIDALMAAQRKNRKIIPCPECERLQLEADCAGKNAAKYHDIIREQRREIERLQKKCDYKDEVIDQRNAECSRQFKKIERLQNELKTCCDHDNIWKHAQEMGFEMANNELKAENKRLRLLQEDTALQCLHQEDEIKRLRVALERIEQLDERMAPITNMVRAKEIAREALEGER